MAAFAPPPAVSTEPGWGFTHAPSRKYGQRCPYWRGGRLGWRHQYALARRGAAARISSHRLCCPMSAVKCSFRPTGRPRLAEPQTPGSSHTRRHCGGEGWRGSAGVGGGWVGVAEIGKVMAMSLEERVRDSTRGRAMSLRTLQRLSLFEEIARRFEQDGHGSPTTENLAKFFKEQVEEGNDKDRFSLNGIKTARRIVDEMLSIPNVKTILYAAVETWQKEECWAEGMTKLLAFVTQASLGGGSTATKRANVEFTISMVHHRRLRDKMTMSETSFDNLSGKGSKIGEHAVGYLRMFSYQQRAMKELEQEYSAPGEELDIAVLEKTSTLEGMHKFLQEADETRLAACRKSTQQHVSIRQGILDGTYDGAFRQVLKTNAKPQIKDFLEYGTLGTAVEKLQSHFKAEQHRDFVVTADDAGEAAEQVEHSSEPEDGVIQGLRPACRPAPPSGGAPCGRVRASQGVRRVPKPVCSPRSTSVPVAPPALAAAPSLWTP